MLSVILFGSAATGGFVEISDVDLLFVLRDGASPNDQKRIHCDITNLETVYGFGGHGAKGQTVLETLFEKVTANHRSILVCNREDFLSGNVARILRVRPAQALFVDRIVIPSICSSSVTLWGEDLVTQVSIAPIRRFDVLKSFYSLSNQVIVSAVFFLFLPKATKYAMSALKASVHSCFFCYHARRASLDEEIDFFSRRYGSSRALKQLLELRRAYAKSFRFVLLCIPTLARLHLRTALDAPFGA